MPRPSCFPSFFYGRKEYMKTLCPNKEVCGSCAWSNMEYPAQLKQKLSSINTSFKIKNLPFRCKDIAASPITEHYRNRMDFVIDFEGRVGLRQKGKWWKVIDAHTCFIADRKIETAYWQTREWARNSGLSYYDRKTYEGFLRYAVIRSTTLGQTMITIITSPPTKNFDSKNPISVNEAAAQNALMEFAKNNSATSVVWAITSSLSDLSRGENFMTLKGPGVMEEKINDLSYRITPNAFFQTNPHAAPLLQKTVVDFCGGISGKTVLDLYCGSGFLSLLLAKKSARVTGVEEVKDAIADARVNAEQNKIKAEFFAAKIEEWDRKPYNADVVVLDPPRSGLHEKVLQEILASPPETLVYVSCNPKNFARECVELSKVYNVTTLRAIDMFPHTPHVELVARLVRKKSSA